MHSQQSEARVTSSTITLQVTRSLTLPISPQTVPFNLDFFPFFPSSSQLTAPFCLSTPPSSFDPQCQQEPNPSMSSISFLARITAFLPLSLLTYSQPPTFIPAGVRITTFCLHHLRASPAICLLDLIFLLDSSLHCFLFPTTSSPSRLRHIAASLISTRYGWPLPDTWEASDDWQAAVRKQLADPEEGWKELEKRLERVREQRGKYGGDVGWKRATILVTALAALWRAVNIGMVDGGWVGGIEIASSVIWVLDWVVNEVILVIGLGMPVGQSTSGPISCPPPTLPESLSEKPSSQTEPSSSHLSSPPISLLTPLRTGIHHMLLLYTQFAHHILPTFLLYPFYHRLVFTTTISHVVLMFTWLMPIPRSTPDDPTGSPPYDLFKYQQLGYHLVFDLPLTASLSVIPTACFLRYALSRGFNVRMSSIAWVAVLAGLAPLTVVWVPFVIPIILYFVMVIISAVLGTAVLIVEAALLPIIALAVVRGMVAWVGWGRRIGWRSFQWWWEVGGVPAEGRIWGVEVSAEVVVACWLISNGLV
ncbi:hypothetical protein EX30DRAFT_145810 [Ascodesmis nigricans]|uniref:Uncharacterized protein n=1 Tax=Ascodesmis nigricans TaxID=341454 RepID=A0A4S2N1W8_9PEZI|nr:hypothetical protein EX30DRAFT_145810 [Ascodesmis nigricans]